MTKLRWTDGLVALGGLLTVLAVAWWWIVFDKLVETQTMTVGEIMPCLAAYSDLCTLAQSLCQQDHFLGIEAYFAESFWISATVLASALVLRFMPAEREA
ncbi:hypothetical protein [Rhizobium sp.]